MSLPAFVDHTKLTASNMREIVEHLQGAAAKTEAWHFRTSTGNNFLITLSDNAGVRKWSVRDSDLVEVLSVDSDGNLVIAGTFAPGAFTLPVSAAPAPIIEGRIMWDSVLNLIAVGDAAATKLFYPGTVVDKQTFAVAGAGTWTKAAFARATSMTLVRLFGAGGGGGGGSGAAAPTHRCGGSAGGGGAYTEFWIPTSVLGATEATAVGAGGLSGAGGSTAAGNDGGVGGTTSFGTVVLASAFGGGGGLKGTTGSDGRPGSGGGRLGAGGNAAHGTVTTHITGGLPMGPWASNLAFSATRPNPGNDGGGWGGTDDTVVEGEAMCLCGVNGGGSGGAGLANSAGKKGAPSLKGGAGGGGGGPVSAASPGTSLAGGAAGNASLPLLGTGAAGGAINTGTAGTAGATGVGTVHGGWGGGGGGGHNTATGAAGGAGGAAGGGGGGGGGGTPIGGAGGVGGLGYIEVYTFI